MDAMAVILNAPKDLALGQVDLDTVGPADVVVAIEWSGISTGTERLLWTGEMPPFPGMGYPLIPGYESVGRVVVAGTNVDLPLGTRVFVPGARCFGPVRGLFGGAASRVVVPAARVTPVSETLEEEAVLFALAATAYRAVSSGAGLPELIVGHGVLGRLIARITMALGGRAPTVWEARSDRREGDFEYRVLPQEVDQRNDYSVICDVSGDAHILDVLTGRLTRGGEVVLAGFYSERVSFAFPPAFMREMRLRVSAEWQPDDLIGVDDLIQSGKLSLAGLITHRAQADEAVSAYKTAFDDPACLKMILDWRNVS